MAYNLTTDKTWSQTLDDLAETFRKWSVSTWSVEPTNPGRRAANRNQTTDERTVTLRYTRRGQTVELVMREQERAVDNIRVLYLVVEALRLNESRGLGATVAEAYRQTYPALPAPQTAGPGVSTAGVRLGSATQNTQTPQRVLFVRNDAPLAVCEAAYRALAKDAHPDRPGGSHEQMARLTAAIEAIRKEKEA